MARILRDDVAWAEPDPTKGNEQASRWRLAKNLTAPRVGTIVEA